MSKVSAAALATHEEMPKCCMARWGTEIWMLAPVRMQWHGQLSAEICAQIENRNRSIAKVAENIDHDDLVRLGWAPGSGCVPASYSNMELVEFLMQWNKAGAPCSAE